jgi:hypothetical protein
MAISQFTEPDINLFFDDLTQAARLNNKASFYGKGYINIMLSNMDNTDIPLLLQGSMLECGGVLFVGDSDTSITGTPSSEQNYIYFNPSTMELSYSINVPTWNTVKGGWYNGNDRAVAKLFYCVSGNQFNGKVILDSYNTMVLINTTQPLPTNGGNLIATVTKEAEVQIIPLLTGAYRFELKGARGGNGGAGNISYPAGQGVDGEIYSAAYFVDRAVEYARAYSAFDGRDGNVGIYSGGYYSGGSGGYSGSNAWIIVGERGFLARGGSGGGGSAGENPDFSGREGGGGGGGGGYGVGGNGADRSYGKGGKGGNNSAGGTGGSVLSSTPGPSSGENGMFNTSQHEFFFVDDLIAIASGGAGGKTYVNTTGTITPVIIYTPPGGFGPEKTTSTGYAKIYRLW